MKFNLENLKNMDKSKLVDPLFMGGLLAGIIATKIISKKFKTSNEGINDLDEFTKERLVKQLNTLQGNKRKDFIDSIIEDGTFYKCDKDILDRIDIFVLQEIYEAHNEHVLKAGRKSNK